MVNVAKHEQGKTETVNPIKALLKEGQAVWQDDISREMLQSGTLRQRVEEVGIQGVTSNPTIFQKAIAAGDAYDEDIKRLLQDGQSPEEIFESLAVQDIQDACDLFRPLYDELDGEDGYVSIEVSAALARDTEGTLEDARRLWRKVDRPNVMIKVPGTKQGWPAIETLLAEGVNVNITLLFSLAHYERVALAYISALTTRLDAGQPVDRMASVASFFVSRVDTLVDKKINEKLAQTDDASERARLDGLKGKAAIANARLAYEKFQEIFEGDRFARLREAGAHVQRPLWASTGTKNKAYSDVLYVETLIGPHTVNTMPVPTMDAFLDHGTVARTVDRDYAEAHGVMDELAAAGISIDEVTAQLEEEGIATFAKSFDELLAGVAEKRSALAEAVAAS
ncbi:MAG: transaldolase [Chloroflexia bacterium]|nr:transaldolase [Chloroflexia bacterium]